MRAGASERTALIGFGAMGRQLCDLLAEHRAIGRLVAVLDVPDRLGAARAALPSHVAVTSSLDEVLGARPTLVVECAGHGGLAACGAAVLAAGADLLVASVGALADAALEQALSDAASASGGRVLLPSGALGGLDVLAAARYAGLDEVAYISNKPVRGWRGTRAESLVDLDALDAPTVFFTGNAREAALSFPQNANVAAAVAIAGVGFERTNVKLTADPAATGNRHRIMARGAFGSIDVTVEGRTLAANPKTSIVAGMSLVKAILGRSAPIVFA